MILNDMDMLVKMASLLSDYVPEGYTVRNRRVVGDLTYIGMSKPGTYDTSSDWYIKRINNDETSDEFIRTSSKGSWTNVLTLNYI